VEKDDNATWNMHADEQPTSNFQIPGNPVMDRMNSTLPPVAARIITAEALLMLAGSPSR
jgi:hypothetical protein